MEAPGPLNIGHKPDLNDFNGPTFRQEHIQKKMSCFRWNQSYFINLSNGHRLPMWPCKVLCNCVSVHLCGHGGDSVSVCKVIACIKIEALGRDYDLWASVCWNWKSQKLCCIHVKDLTVEDMREWVHLCIKKCLFASLFGYEWWMVTAHSVWVKARVGTPNSQGNQMHSNYLRYQ